MADIWMPRAAIPTLRFGFIWNARLCEAFYLPCQFVEVACRNAISRTPAERFGDRWHQHESFRAILPARLRMELDKAHSAARARQHGDLGTHILASLTFGFWVHLLTRAFDFTLWKTGIARCFPHAPPTAKLSELHDRVDWVWVMRNRIGHHRAVFDKRPMAEHANMVTLIGWICLDMRWLRGRLTQVPGAINRRPRL